jgi:hypothetical protein
MKTKFEVPTIFTLLDLNDHQLVFVELLSRINKYFGKGSSYRFYSMDLRMLLNQNKNVNDRRLSNIGLDKLLEPFNGLIKGVEVDDQTWYITPNWMYKSPWTAVEITDDAAIKAYWYLLGRTAGHKFEDENTKTFDKYLVAGRNGKVYGCCLGILDYDQKRELN